MVKFLLTMPCIGAAHFALAVGMYYMRGASDNRIVASDFVVLLLPLILAFSVYFLVARNFHTLYTQRRPVQFAAAASIALVALFVSTSCAAIYAFNRWGI